LWEMERYQSIVDWTAHAFWVDTLAFSLDGMVLVSGGLDGTVKVWGIPKDP
jgi:WD40 repeat protein